MKRWMVYAGMYVLALSCLLLQYTGLERAAQEAQLEKKQLVVLAMSSELQESARFIAAKEMFMQSHPDFRVQIKTTHKFIPVLLAAGDHGADLAYGLSLPPEYFEDLRAYGQIMAELDSHWIDIGAMKDESGRIFGLASSAGLQTFSSVLFARDADALTSAGISLPQNGFSYAQFRALGRQARQQGKTLLAMDAGAGHILDAHHALCPGSGYDSGEFRAALDFWREMYEAGYVVFAGDVSRSDALLTCSCWRAQDPDGNLLDLQSTAVLDGRSVPFPTAQGSAQTFLPIRALYLPKDSAQKDVAVDLLACFASLDAQKELENGRDGMLLSDIKQYDRWRRWTWQQASGFYAYPGIDADGYFRWVGMLEKSAFAPMRNTERALFGELFPQYLAGKLTQDELISRLQQTEGAV